MMLVDAVSETPLKTKSQPPRTGTDDRGPGPSNWDPLVGQSARWLPAQGPIEVFVHHNTLHALEQEPFHQAVVTGWNRLGGQPYWPEDTFRAYLRSGRILWDDLCRVVDQDLSRDARRWPEALGARHGLRMAMLEHPLQVNSEAERRWVIAETDALDSFFEGTPVTYGQSLIADAQSCLERRQPLAIQVAAEQQSDGGEIKLRDEAASWTSYTLRLLYAICQQGCSGVAGRPNCRKRVRPRDQILAVSGYDIDEPVHDVLIRFCGAFLDQGYSDWEMPDRQKGFLHAFLELYSDPGFGRPAWQRHLPGKIACLRSTGRHVDDVLDHTFEEFGVATEWKQELVTQSLLALRGWAGMVWQRETVECDTAHPIPKGSLKEFLAVRWLLEKQAIDYFSHRNRYAPVANEMGQHGRQKGSPDAMHREWLAFLIFRLAQLRGWNASTLLALSDDDWVALIDQVESFSNIERRRTFHEAWEGRYRRTALDAFAVHANRVRAGQVPAPAARPSFQLVTCIDDREESFRRHLEEVEPECETFGAAGFFAVAMYYRGAAEGSYRPLCPGVITPDHYVQEDVGYTFEGIHRNRAELRRRWGWARHLFHTESRNFVGGMLAGLTGSLATAPLVARVLFPRLTSRIQQRFGNILQPPPVTRLQLERHQEPPGPENGHIGYTLDEMASVVVRLLQDIGLTESSRFSRVVVICGHGSSSLNNPHESAYCCGACAGKRGGPNARAFAAMANDYRVRWKVRERGIAIPDDTTFVGAYHNTCDDSVVFFDLDGLPSSHRGDFERVHRSIEIARKQNAHERCRRFVSAALDLSLDEALKHVEARAQDISQVRPEYNHATNALVVVGRRCWNRGLFLDRRSFLTSYDPAQDDTEHSILFRILSAAVPVCAGINLEYYFSCVDPVVYGSGSKLPHNVVSLLGVMEGSSSDLRTGLYQQMIEIHEPLRLLFVIETTSGVMLDIMERNPVIGRLVRGNWIQVAVFDPDRSAFEWFDQGQFRPYEVGKNVPEVRPNSRACYLGNRDHLPFLSIVGRPGGLPDA